MGGFSSLRPVSLLEGVHEFAQIYLHLLWKPKRSKEMGMSGTSPTAIFVRNSLPLRAMSGESPGEGKKMAMFDDGVDIFRETVVFVQ